jgi:hypothetical protein
LSLIYLLNFQTFYNNATPSALVGEPSLTSVDPLISKSTAKTCVFAESC